MAPDWRVLRPHDPIPGNPQRVLDGAQDYQRVKEAIDTATEDLHAVINGKLTHEMLAESVDALRESAVEVRIGLTQVAGRYEVAAQAIGEYGNSLLQEQKNAYALEVEAQAAQQKAERYKQDETNAQNDGKSCADELSWYNIRITELKLKLLNPLLSEADKLDIQRALRELDNNAAGARKRLENAQVKQDSARKLKNLQHEQIADLKIKLQEALKRRDEVAKKAAKQLTDHIRCDGLKDSWWDRFLEVIANIIKAVVEWAVEAVVNVVEGIKKCIQGLIAMCAAGLHMLAYALEGDLEGFKRSASQWVEGFFTCIEGLNSLAKGVGSILSVVSVVLMFVPGMQPVAVAVMTATRVATITKHVTEGILIAGGRSEMGWGEFAVGVGTDIIMSYAGHKLGKIAETKAATATATKAGQTALSGTVSASGAVSGADKAMQSAARWGKARDMFDGGQKLLSPAKGIAKHYDGPPLSSLTPNWSTSCNLANPYQPFGITKMVGVAPRSPIPMTATNRLTPGIVQTVCEGFSR